MHIAHSHRAYGLLKRRSSHGFSRSDRGAKLMRDRPDAAKHDQSASGRIGENAPNEANFDETMSIVEAQESIQVTANSGALSGLDNGAAQPGEGSTPEPGKAPGLGSESGNPKKNRKTDCQSVLQSLDPG